MKREWTSCVCLLLAAASAGTVTACGNPDKESSEETTVTASAAETMITEPEETVPVLDVPKADYGGKEFVILTVQDHDYEFAAEEETGDIVPDAVWRRNLQVEDLLNIQLNIQSKKGDWNNRDFFNQLVRRSVLSNDGAYDLVSGLVGCVMLTSADGLYMDAFDLKYINFDNPWWVKDMDKSIAIGGKLFGFTGDINLSVYKNLPVIYFNKAMLSEFDLGNPYEMVRNGTWTIDRLIEMTNAVTADLNGDGKMNVEHDRLGYYYAAVPQNAFQTACEYQFITFDDKGKPCIVPLSDRDAALYAKMYDFIYKNPGVYGKPLPGNEREEYVSHFAAGHALFLNDYMFTTEFLRNMGSDFGIVPLPKRDEMQKNYHSNIGTAPSMLFVPISVKDPDLVSMVCESMGYYSYLNVIPTYYEVALKEKYTRDADTKEMVEIIRNSAAVSFEFTFGTMFWPSINNILPNSWEDQPNIASKYESSMPAWNDTIDKIWEAYSLLDQS